MIRFLFSLLVLPLLLAELTAQTPVSLQPLTGQLLLTQAVPRLAERNLFRNLTDNKSNALILISENSDSTTNWEEAGFASIRQFSPGTAGAALEKATAVWLETATLPEPVLKAVHAFLARGGQLGVSGNACELPGLIPGVAITTQPLRSGNRPVMRAGQPMLRLGEGAVITVQDRELQIMAGTATICWGKSALHPARCEKLGKNSLLDLCQIRRAAEARAATSPFPPPNPALPKVDSGALVIVGGGGSTPEIWKRFISLAGGRDAPIVVIPTAMPDPVPLVNPIESTLLRRYGARNVTVLHTRDRKKADDPAFSEILIKAGGVWFGGGRQWRFVEAYAGTRTEKRFHVVLDRGGVIGGSSAGASIQSEYMPRGHPLGNMVMMAEGYERGFGFLPGCAVDQHFFARNRTRDMTALVTRYPQLLGIGIDEATALVVRGHIGEVIGKSRVAFYDYRQGPPKIDPDYVTAKAGERYDLKARKLLK